MGLLCEYIQYGTHMVWYFFAFCSYKNTIFRMVTKSTLKINTIHGANSNVSKIEMGLLCEYGQFNLCLTAIENNKAIICKWRIFYRAKAEYSNDGRNRIHYNLYLFANKGNDEVVLTWKISFKDKYAKIAVYKQKTPIIRSIHIILVGV
ncbi:AAEL017284-PA [Aedes aegypti]|uniref:AAEL017284-PA n=1 Tax=Aedes aegypti TaxID=7159 RepID=J9HYG7_AEDAE|nr:AAEL017284-PA [Aedes aegypti]